MNKTKKTKWEKEFSDGMWGCNCGLTEEDTKKKGKAYHHGWMYFKSTRK